MTAASLIPPEKKLKVRAKYFCIICSVETITTTVLGLSFLKSIIFFDCSQSQNSSKIIGSADTGLFKNDFEKNLYKRIHDIRKYFSSLGKSENYEESLKTLSLAKNEVDAFFDNVVVNDNDPIIKKNRLELLKMLCKSFENYFEFSKINF